MCDECLGCSLLLTLRLISGKVSLSPSTLSYALNKYNVNWQYWYVIDIGFSTYYPQVYRTTAEAFSKELDYTLMELKSALGAFICSSVSLIKLFHPPLFHLTSTHIVGQSIVLFTYLYKLPTSCSLPLLCTAAAHFQKLSSHCSF